MYEQSLHMQHNSSTSGCSATRVLQGYLSGNTTHTVLQRWWLGHEITLPAQQNTVGHKKGFPKRPLIFLHPKTGRSLTISQLNGGWFSQERRPEIKFFIPKGWSTQRNQRTGCPYPRKWWDTLVAPLCKDSLMWIVLSHHWLRKNRGEQSSQTQLMMTTNWHFP
jgi:hypothetical protein